MDETHALAILTVLKDHKDTEVAHSTADETLCLFLVHLGYTDIVEAWKKIPKWYA